ncbi:hypothetical protein H4Q26_008067 [Puccinia striiformis f. sp. tritici PST-130]|nr:hypothetical protein H4Q26_008067 [Puccinia striiformis f. sp. tritici PST-130]
MICPTNPDSHVSKRPACHLINDVSQNSNSINPRLNSDSARSSKSLLDHQSSRSNNENHATPQDIEFNQSQSNEPSGSSLLQRISLPFKGPPPPPLVSQHTRVREIDAFEYKAAIETRGLETLAKHDSATARSINSKNSNNSSTALASNTGYKQKRPNKRPAPSNTNTEWSCNGGKHDPRAPHPPEHCWTLHPEQREEYLAKKRACQAANANCPARNFR